MSAVGKQNKSVKVQIKADAAGYGSVIVDGHDLSNVVSGIDVYIEAKEFLSMDLHLAGIELEADIEALVQNIGVTKRS